MLKVGTLYADLTLSMRNFSKGLARAVVAANGTAAKIQQAFAKADIMSAMAGNADGFNKAFLGSIDSLKDVAKTMKSIGDGDYLKKTKENVGELSRSLWGLKENVPMAVAALKELKGLDIKIKVDLGGVDKIDLTHIKEVAKAIRELNAIKPNGSSGAEGTSDLDRSMQHATLSMQQLEAIQQQFGESINVSKEALWAQTQVFSSQEGALQSYRDSLLGTVVDFKRFEDALFMFKLKQSEVVAKTNVDFPMEDLIQAYVKIGQVTEKDIAATRTLKEEFLRLKEAAATDGSKGFGTTNFEDLAKRYAKFSQMSTQEFGDLQNDWTKSKLEKFAPQDAAFAQALKYSQDIHGEWNMISRLFDGQSLDMASKFLNTKGAIDSTTASAKQLSEAIQKATSASAQAATGTKKKLMLPMDTQFFAGKKDDSKKTEAGIRKVGNALKEAGQQGKIAADRVKKFVQATAQLAGSTKSVAQLPHIFEMMSSEINGAAAQAGKFNKEFGNITRGIVLAQGFYAALAALKNGIKSLVEFQGNLEVATRSFGGLIGNASLGDEFVYMLQDVADASLYTAETAEAAARQLLSMGFVAKEIKPMMDMLGDAGAFYGMDDEKLQRASYALGEIRANGKLYKTEMRQLVSAGIPAYRLMAEGLGITQDALTDLIKDGLDGNKALDGLFKGIKAEAGGASERLMGTFRQAFSTIKDNMLQISGMFSDGIFKEFSSSLKVIADELVRLKKMGRDWGAGGILTEALPKDTADRIRKAVAAFQEFRKALGDLMKAAGPLGGEIFKAFLDVLANTLQVLSSFTRWTTQLVQVMGPLNGILGRVIRAFLSFSVLYKTTSLVMGLFKAILAFKSLGAAIEVIKTAAGAFRLLGIAMVSNPWVAGAAIIIAALAGIAMQFQVVKDWVDKATASLGNFFNMDYSTVLNPVAQKHESLDGLKDAIGGIEKDTEDAGDAAGGAAKKIDKFLASFDEVFQVPEKDDSGGGDSGGLGGLLDDALDLGEIENKGNEIPTQLNKALNDWKSWIPEPIVWAPFKIEFPDFSNFKWPGPPAIPSWSPLTVTVFEWALQPIPIPEMPKLPSWAPVKIPAFDFGVVPIPDVEMPKRPAWAPMPVPVFGWVIDAFPVVSMPKVPAWAPVVVKLFEWAIPQLPIEMIAKNATSAVQAFKDVLKNGFAKPMPEIETGVVANFRQLQSKLSLDVPVKVDTTSFSKATASIMSQMGAVKSKVADTSKGFVELEHNLGMEGAKTGAMNLQLVKDGIDKISPASIAMGESLRKYANVDLTSSTKSIADLRAMLAEAYQDTSKYKFSEVVKAEWDVAVADTGSKMGAIKSITGEVKQGFVDLNNVTAESTGLTLLDIGTLISAISGVSGAVSGMTPSMQNFGNNSQLAFSGASSAALGTQAAVQGIGTEAMLSVGFLGSIKDAFGGAGKAAGEVKQTNEEINAELAKNVDGANAAMQAMGLASYAMNELTEAQKRAADITRQQWENVGLQALAQSLEAAKAAGVMSDVEAEAQFTRTQLMKAAEFDYDNHYKVVTLKQLANEKEQQNNESAHHKAMGTILKTNLLDVVKVWQMCKTDVNKTSDEMKADNVKITTEMGSAMTLSLGNAAAEISKSIELMKTNTSTSMTGFQTNATTTTSGVSSEYKKMQSSISSAMTTANGSVSSSSATMTSTLGKLKSYLATLSGSISSWWDNFWGGLTEGKQKLSEAGASASTVSKNTKVKGYATGGIISRNQVIEVAEGNKREAVVPLENASAMAPFASAVADGIVEAIGPLFAQTRSGNGGGEDKRPLYVGTLIADERGLRELDRKLRIISVEEDGRTFTDV